MLALDSIRVILHIGLSACKSIFTGRLPYYPLSGPDGKAERMLGQSAVFSFILAVIVYISCIFTA